MTKRQDRIDNQLEDAARRAASDASTLTAQQYLEQMMRGVGRMPSIPSSSLSGLAPERDVGPVEQMEDAIPAWRWAWMGLADSNTTVALNSINRQGRLLPEAQAVCMGQWNLGAGAPQQCGKAPPTMGCTCGFYGWKSRDLAYQFRHEANFQQNSPIASTMVLLEVNFSGRVIECERGYRAQHQRILGMQLHNKCLMGWLCREPAWGLVMNTDSPCLVTCETHAIGHERPISENQLFEELGVRVKWVDAHRGGI